MKQFGSHYRIKCSTCGKIVGAKIPRGGNGTAHRTRRHFAAGTRTRCEDAWIVYGGGYDYADYLIDRKPSAKAGGVSPTPRTGQ